MTTMLRGVNLVVRDKVSGYEGVALGANVDGVQYILMCATVEDIEKVIAKFNQDWTVDRALCTDVRVVKRASVEPLATVAPEKMLVSYSGLLTQHDTDRSVFRRAS